MYILVFPLSNLVKKISTEGSILLVKHAAPCPLPSQCNLPSSTNRTNPKRQCKILLVM